MWMNWQDENVAKTDNLTSTLNSKSEFLPSGIFCLSCQLNVKKVASSTARPRPCQSCNERIYNQGVKLSSQSFVIYQQTASQTACLVCGANTVLKYEGRFQLAITLRFRPQWTSGESEVSRARRQRQSCNELIYNQRVKLASKLSFIDNKKVRQAAGRALWGADNVKAGPAARSHLVLQQPSRT